MKVTITKGRVVKGYGHLITGETYDLPTETAQALVDLGLAKRTRAQSAPVAEEAQTEED